MAGFYNEFIGEKRFVILTTNANESISDIHDRMPVVITKDLIHNWIYNLDNAINILHDVPRLLERIAV